MLMDITYNQLFDVSPRNIDSVYKLWIIHFNLYRLIFEAFFRLHTKIGHWIEKLAVIFVWNIENVYRGKWTEDRIIKSTHWEALNQMFIYEMFYCGQHFVLWFVQGKQKLEDLKNGFHRTSSDFIILIWNFQKGRHSGDFPLKWLKCTKWTLDVRAQFIMEKH